MLGHRLLAHRRGDLVAFAVLIVALALFPVLAPGPVLGVGVYAMIYAIAAIGLSLLMGLAGQVSLGHAAFFAIGAYTQAVLLTRYDVNGILAGAVAVALAALAALLIGLPLLRLRGHYLALATLGLGIIVTVVATESEYLGATSGVFGVPKPVIAGRSYASPEQFFWLLVPVVVLGLLLARNIVESRVGRALGAVNDSEVAAEVLGVDTYRYRLQVFVLSAAYAGLAGVFYAHWLSVVNPNTANFPLSVKFLLMSVLGGLGSVWGAVIGAFGVEFLDEAMGEYIPRLVPGAAGEVELIGFGLVLTLIMIFQPGGIHAIWRGAIARLQRARRPVASASPSAAVDGDGTAQVTDVGTAQVTGGDDAPLLARQGRPPPGTTVLRVRGLTKRFGGVVAVDDVDLEVKAGEILALIGPNGAGKTTCFNMISGVLPPTSGEVILGQQRIDGRKPHVFAQARATRTFQNLQVFRSVTVRGNVLVGRHLRSTSGMLRGALVLPAVHEERAARAAADEVIGLLGLGEDADRSAVDLPFGRQRLLEVARALALEPDLLLLDEPMAGLSGSERRALASLLRRLRAGGMAVVLVEHDVEAVLALADRVAVLEDGALIALAPPAQIREDPAVIAAYLGVEAEDLTGGTDDVVELVAGDAGGRDPGGRS